MKLINFHVLAIGGIVSAIFVGLISVITFLPGNPNLASCLVDGVMLQILFLEPEIIVRVGELRRTKRPALAFFTVNTLVAVAYGLACGWIMFRMLPRSIGS